VPPERTDLILSSDIPDVEFGVLVCDGFDVEADGRDRSNVLFELEIVKDSYRPIVSVQICVRNLSDGGCSYSSSQQRPSPTSTAASPWIRRSYQVISKCLRP
jgi:hypothetical protein